MPVTLIRIGVALFLGGFLSYFFHHGIVTAALIAGLGYLITVIGTILWSVEKSGDASFS